MKNVKGFTLIELMVVVAIIGILASMFIPVFIGDKGSSPVVNAAPEKYYDTDDVKSGYIDNNKRSSDIVTLKRHSDGQLYACNGAGDDCKLVAQ